MKRPKLSIEQMAEVYELRNGKSGKVAWENLAIIFGVHKKTIKKYYRQAELFGFDLWTDLRH